MDSTNLSDQALRLVQKIKHLVITASGRTIEEASTEEFYQAFCSILREEMMINWSASLKTMEQKKVRTAFLLSMEYLPGKMLGNNIAKIGAAELVQRILAQCTRNLSDILACEPDPGLGHGGLGRLSSCFLDSLATLQYPARAYGLRYQYGIFEQELWDGLQVEKPDCWLLNTNPWELRRDSHAVLVHFKGKTISVQNGHGDPVDLLENAEDVRAIPYEIPVIGYSAKPDYSVLMLRLWSTKESPRNFQLQRYNSGFFAQAAENTSLTDILYPTDNTELGKRIRLKQEFLLVSASLQDIIRRTLRIYGDVQSLQDKVRIQINDTHAALLVAELVRTLTKNYNFSFPDAWETCQAICGFTNHTILPEALEQWSEKRLKELLPRQYRVIQKLNEELCSMAQNRFSYDDTALRKIALIDSEQVRMAHLAIAGSHKVNGVASLHTSILQEKLFAPMNTLFPNRFLNITNGVSQRRWLLYANPLLSAFITKRIGKGWITDFQQIARLHPFAEDIDAQKEFLAIKQKNKEALLLFLSKENPMRDRSGKIIGYPPIPSTHALFDVQIKRFHEYKRQLLHVLHLIMLYQELKTNKNARSIERFSIFSGKTAPNYVRARQILRLTFAVCRFLQKEQETVSKLSAVFVENYNVSKAEIIIPAADLSEQISTAGWEASGTGNMKLTMNGALTIATDDGANIEMRASVQDQWWPFPFGNTAEQNQTPYNPQEIYENDAQIRNAVDTLKSGVFATTALENTAFTELYEYLVTQDPYRVLQDLRSYYTAQKKIEKLFTKPLQWAQTAIHNIAAMGPFSSDVSIRNYAEKVWEITPCPPDPSILQTVREQYAEHDQCRIKLTP